MTKRESAKRLIRAIRVALVEDDESIRKALRRLLSVLGHDTEVFASGRAFLDSTPLDRHDCVIVDMQMPGMSGLELLRRLGEHGVRVPAVMVTGQDASESREQCLAAGAQAYLQKPIDDELLVQAIERAVGFPASPTASPPGAS